MNENFKTFLLSLLIFLTVFAITLTINVATVKASYKIRNYITRNTSTETLLKAKPKKLIQQGIKNLTSERDLF